MALLSSRLIITAFAVFFVCLSLAITSPMAKESTKTVTIGTGAVTGVYYPAGGAICRLLNRERKEHGIRCFVESTGGSIYNLNALRDGELDFGIVQSDWQYNAYKGQGVFAHGPAMTKLRSVFSLHSEMFTVVARGDSDIRSFDDLKGHRVNVGNPGSGMRAIMDELMDIKGWGKGSFKEVLELKPADQARALCENKIDAMVFAAGHPNGLIQEVTSMCNARIVPVDGTEVAELLNAHPYYARTSIPGGMYRGNAVDIPTFGIKATLVTTEDADEETVYQLTKAVFDNFDSFKTLHFVFATLDKERMVSAGLTAPLHEGALRYYREAGLLK
jgi:uncharacterized protein